MNLALRIALPAFLIPSSVALSQTVAITEFLNNPTSLDDGREYVELFNYGAEDVDLTGWTLADEDNDLFTFDSVSIASGDYLVVVNGDASVIARRLSAAEAKQVFEEEWLGGVADPRVIGIEGKSPPEDENFILANGGDELILSNDSGEVVWSVAESGDDDNGVATYHTSTELWTVPSIYGSKAAPGVDREGDDLEIEGFLGYEHAATGSSANGFVGVEPAAYESDPSDLESLFGPNGAVFTGPYDNSEAGTSVASSFGSPLAGAYLVMPATGDLVGDYNGDNVVDAADYTLWRDNLGDADGDALMNRAAGLEGTEVTVVDYENWRDAFGDQAAGVGAVASPEPASYFLVALTATVAGLPRRR